MAGNATYQTFMSPTSKETYPIRLWKAFLQVRRADGFKTVIREKVKKRMGDNIMEEDEPGASVANWERNFDRVFQGLVNDGIIFHVEDDEYDMTERAHDILEAAHGKLKIPWESFSNDEESKVIRECVWHFPGRRRKAGTTETGKAPGEPAKKPRISMSEGPSVRTGTGRPRGRPRGSGLRRSMAPRAHAEGNYPPMDPVNSTRRHKSNSPVRRMEVDPPEPQSPEMSPPEQNCAPTFVMEPLSHPIPSNQHRYPSIPPPRSHSVPHILPPIQASVSHQAQMSQQPTPDPSTPSPSSEESSQPPVLPPPPEPMETQPVETQPMETQPIETQPIETQPIETQPIETQPVENAELEQLRRENEDLLSQLIEAREALASGEHLDSDQKLRDKLADALDNLACTEREVSRRGGEIIALRKKLKALEGVVQYQSAEGPIHQLIETRDQEIKELRATNEAQASTNISLRRSLDAAQTRAKDSDTFANRAELRVLDLEAELQKLADASRAIVAKQQKTIEAQKEENGRLNQKVNGLGQALNELRDSRGQALNQAREEIQRMSEQLLMAEQTNALQRAMPPPPSPPKSRASTSGMSTEAQELCEAIRTIEQQKNHIQKLRGKLDSHKLTIDEQALKLQRFQEENYSLHKQIGVLEAKKLTFDAMRNDLQARNEQLVMLQHQCNGHDREKMGFYNQISGLRHELNNAREELNKTREELNKPWEELNKTREELNNTREELNSREEELANCRHEHAQLTEQNERLQKASDEHIECMNQFSDASRKWEAEAARRLVSLETQKGEIKKLQLEAKQRRDELASARKDGSRVGSLEQENRELKKQEEQARENMEKMWKELEGLSLLQKVAVNIAEKAQEEVKTLKEQVKELEQSNQGLRRELEVEKDRLPNTQPSTSEEPQPTAKPMEIQQIAEQPAEPLQKEQTSEEPQSNPSISPPSAHAPTESKEEEQHPSRPAPISASASLLALQAQYGNDDDYEMEDIQKTADVISEKTNISKSPTVPKRKASRASMLKATRPGPS